MTIAVDGRIQISVRLKLDRALVKEKKYFLNYGFQNKKLYLIHTKSI